LPSSFPTDAAVDLDRALHRLDGEPVMLATEGFEHADQVAGVGNGGAEAFADRLVVSAVPQVVLAAGAPRRERGPDLAGVATQLEDRVAAEGVLREVERLAVDAPRVEAFERCLEAIQVPRLR